MALPQRCLQCYAIGMTALTKTSISAHIRAEIQSDIESGAFAPGVLLDERSLAERFKVSRTPIREALQQLAAQNLVRIVPRIGVYVSRLTISQLRETLELLGEIEAVAAKLAARRMTELQRETLQACQQACRDAQDGHQFAEANSRFHEIIYAGSHNEYLIEQIQSIRRSMLRYRAKIFLNETQRQRALEEHQRLVDALLRGDEEAAHAAMLGHAPVGTTGFSEFLATIPPHYLENESPSDTIDSPGMRRSRRGRRPPAAKAT